MNQQPDAKKDVKISISHCRKWSSSFVRDMRKAGAAASAIALAKASKTGADVSFIEEGVLKVKSAKGKVTRIKELKVTS